MKRVRNRLCELCAVMVSLTLVTTSMVCGLMARYVSASSGTEEARVALMASDVELGLSDTIYICPGDEIIVPVTLTNYYDDVVCEVAQRYVMTVEYISEAFSANLPLQYGVYTNEGCTDPVTVEKNGENIPGASDEFKAGVKEDPDQYWIKVTWPQDKKGAGYAFEIDALKLKVHVEQID